MRKSIFLTVILAFFLLGLNVQMSAQDCTPTSQKPTSGVDYTYEVAITGAAGATDQIYNWYITQNVNLLDASAPITASNSYFTVSADESDYNSTVSADTSERLKLQWTNNAIAEQAPFYLVIKYSENNGTCVVNNLKVMEIMPLNSFKLAIKPVQDEAGTAFTSSANVCVADVSGATVTAGTSDQGTSSSDTKVTYTYGENTLYYKVTASGFVGDWTPQIQLPALETGQKYVSAQWSADGGTNWNDFTGLAQDATTQQLTSSSENASITDATNGTAIIYKVVINNNTYETLADQTLAVATDGTGVVTGSTTMNDQTDTCSGDETAFGDEGSTTIKARPTVEAGASNFLITVQ